MRGTTLNKNCASFVEALHGNLLSMTRALRGACLLGTLCCAFTPRQARACGGILQPERGTVSQTAQVAILSVHDGVTDVTLTLEVPRAGNDFGVLVPVPSEPRIATTPISVEAVNALEQATRPAYYETTSQVAEDSGCGGTSAAKGSGSPPTRGVVASEPVVIGSVSATWLRGSSGNEIAAWLTERDFVLPEGAGALLDQYTQEGLSFIAFTRAQANGEGSRVGVRFTLDGDRRAYALRMTRLGAATEMTINLFIATTLDKPLGPDAPYASLAIDDLAIDGDYRAGVADAVEDAGGKAFVVESFGATAALPAVAGALFVPEAYVTRLSTVTRPGALDADVTFTRESKVAVQSFGEVATADPKVQRSQRGLPPSLASLGLVAGSVVARRRRKQV